MVRIDLTAKQRRFAEGLAAGLSAPEAHRLAYSAERLGDAARTRRAERLAGDSRVRDLVERLGSAGLGEGAVGTAEPGPAAPTTGPVDRAWVVERLVENIDRAMAAKAVTDRSGKATGVFSYQGAIANRALELLGRELGMFTERRGGARLPFEGTADDELDRVIRRLAVEVGLMPGAERESEADPD